MNPPIAHTLEELLTPAETDLEELVDDPKHNEIWDMEAIAKETADYEAGLIELIPWEQIKTELHAKD